MHTHQVTCPCGGTFAIHVTRLTNRRRALFSHDGRTGTVAQWAEWSGIRSGTIRFRLDQGWSFAEAVTRPVVRGKPPGRTATAKRVTYKGEQRTIAEWASAYDMSVHVLRHRLKAGWPVARALTTPTAVYKPRVAKGAAAGGGSELQGDVGDRRTVVSATSDGIGVFTP